MARYLVVRRPHATGDYSQNGYEVVDTDTTGDSTAEVTCPATTMANAAAVAEALNGQPVQDLATAKRALVMIHRFIEQQLDKDPCPNWGGYYNDSELTEFVNEVQHYECEEPF